jgi:hypothetical protein
MHHSALIPRLSNPFREAAFRQSGQACSSRRAHEIAIIAAKTARASCRGEARNRSFIGGKGNERTAANPRASARKKNEPLGADRAVPLRAPEHLCCEGATEFREADRPLPRDRGATGADDALVVSAALSVRGSTQWHTHGWTKWPGSAGAARGPPEERSA